MANSDYPGEFGSARLFKFGRYIDEVLRIPEGLKFALRWVIYDDEMISNSFIYPIK